MAFETQAIKAGNEQSDIINENYSNLSAVISIPMLLWQSQINDRTGLFPFVPVLIPLIKEELDPTKIDTNILMECCELSTIDFQIV